jgi:sarcosine oxidase subunit gamma
VTADRAAFPGQVDLRIDPSDADALERLARDLGFDLPREPKTVVGDPAGRHALWLGPDEWLVVGPPGSEGEIESALREAVGGSFGAVVDVSANRLMIELAGPSARETLESGCTIDLHPSSFGPGHCAQTLLARANVLLHQISDEPRYRLYVRPSFAGYVHGWLSDAAPRSAPWSTRTEVRPRRT